MKGKCCANKELRQVGCGSGPGKTKPIRSRGGYQGQGSAARAPAPELRASCTNKPNCAEPREEASTVREKSYGESDMDGTSAKQSQFTPPPTGTVGGRQGRRWSATGDNRAKQTQSGRSAGAPQGRMRKTNPILRLRVADHVIASEARQSGLRIGNGPVAGCRPCGLSPRACAGRLYKQTQFAPTRPGMGAGGRGRRRRNVRNKPNLPQTIVKARGLGDATRRRAIVSNKPNLAGRPEPRGRDMQNKRNLPRVGSPRPTDRAEQTQFGRPRHPSIPLFQHSNPIPFVRNKANCPKRGTEAVSRDRAEAMDVEQTIASGARQSALVCRPPPAAAAVDRAGGRLYDSGCCECWPGPL
jgi:hypothetical protein